MNSHFTVKKKKKKKRFFGGFSKGGKSNSISVARLEWKFSASYQIRNVTVCCLFCLCLFHFVIRHEDIEITPNTANAKPRMNAGPNIEPKKRIFGDDN
jgi:hypothetical protein